MKDREGMKAISLLLLVLFVRTPLRVVTKVLAFCEGRLFLQKGKRNGYPAWCKSRERGRHAVCTSLVYAFKIWGRDMFSRILADFKETPFTLRLRKESFKRLDGQKRKAEFERSRNQRQLLFLSDEERS